MSAGEPKHGALFTLLLLLQRGLAADCINKRHMMRCLDFTWLLVSSHLGHEGGVAKRDLSFAGAFAGASCPHAIVTAAAR